MGRQDGILTELVVQGHQIVYFVAADLAVEHAKRVVSVGCRCKVTRADELIGLAFVEAVVGDLVATLHLLLDEAFQFAFGELGSGVGATCGPDLLTGAHVQQTLAQGLPSHFVRREVHILAVRHQLIKRLFLNRQKQVCLLVDQL